MDSKFCALLIALTIVQLTLGSPARVVRQAESTTTTTAAPEYTACNTRCLTTLEYNPVCGTDGVTYSNMGRLRCAQQCGKRTELNFRGTCQAL
ncbi:four-domain proteases inhibitor [Aethina tumida]|uniref:four-domain proteases inhibitor n=1 Tax=Aethina tumida TaxID=116153 RepID=UPI00096B1F71|nr:four-domain proteases inhibitor [Aethina tumida]